AAASFGSVANEKLIVLLDGERLGLLNWGGRAGRAATLQVRFVTKAGPHKVGVTFLATNLAPVLDVDRQFMRSTVQTFRTPPELTFFPHVGSVRLEGPVNAVTPIDSPTRSRVFTCRPRTADEESSCARKI